MGGRELDSSGSGQGPVPGCCEHCNELLVPQNPKSILTGLWTASCSRRLLLVQFAVTSDSRAGESVAVPAHQHTGTSAHWHISTLAHQHTGTSAH